MASFTLRLATIATLVMTIILGFGHDRHMVDAQCQGDIPSLISECAQYVRKAGPETPPSKKCCTVAKQANIPCLCKYVTKDIEEYVSVEKAVYVAEYCGVALRHGSKCGSYTIPNA